MENVNDIIVRKITEANANFEKAEANRKATAEQINNLQVFLADIIKQEATLQGEYKALFEVGKALGILDDQGKPISPEVAPTEVASTDAASTPSTPGNAPANPVPVIPGA